MVAVVAVVVSKQCASSESLLCFGRHHHLFARGGRAVAFETFLFCGKAGYSSLVKQVVQL